LSSLGIHCPLTLIPLFNIWELLSFYDLGGADFLIQAIWHFSASWIVEHAVEY